MTTITIPASALNPGFSVYVLEIACNKEYRYYVGMTGDGHFPSARSSFSRLAGHFDTNKSSTQAQLKKELAANYPSPLPP
jgi:hypothetical protein